MKLFDTTETEHDVIHENHTHDMTPSAIVAEAELRHWKALDIQTGTKQGQSFLTIKFENENGAHDMKKMIDAHIKQLERVRQAKKEKLPPRCCTLCGSKADLNSKHSVCEPCIKETIKRELRQKSKRDQELEAKHEKPQKGHCRICEKKIDEKNELGVCDHCVKRLLHKRFKQIEELSKIARHAIYQRMHKK